MITDKRTLEILTQVVYKQLRGDKDFEELHYTKDFFIKVLAETLELAQTIEQVQKEALKIQKDQPPFEDGDKPWKV